LRLTGPHNTIKNTIKAKHGFATISETDNVPGTIKKCPEPPKSSLKGQRHEIKTYFIIYTFQEFLELF